MTTEAAPKRARVAIAAALSLLFPAVGVFYAGRPLLGIAATATVHMSVVLAAAGVAFADASSRTALAVLGLLRIVVTLAAVVLSVRVAAEGRDLRHWHRTKTFCFWLATCLLFAVLSPSLFIESFVQPSESMSPTLRPGDRFFVNTVFGRDVERGDVIAFLAPDLVGTSAGLPWALRVVALEGDSVASREGELVINGVPAAVQPCASVGLRKIASEQSARGGAVECFVERRGGFPDIAVLRDRGSVNSQPSIVVPDDHVFVVGDNRDYSSDSRHWGPVHESLILGRSMGVYWRPSGE